MKMKYLLFVFLMLGVQPIVAAGDVVLIPGNFVVVVAENEAVPVVRAVEALREDFSKVMDYTPEITHTLPQRGKIALMVINETTDIPSWSATAKTLDGFESHRIYCDPVAGRIYLHGKDLRGAIYAIYTFSEHFLKVPPLWYFSSWQPQRMKTVTMSADYDYFRRSPQVRYRAWFPNDQDMYSLWSKLEKQNETIIYETMLRLKLNTIEWESTVSYPYKMSSSAEVISSYGMIITSHHFIALNNSWARWKDYWRQVRNMEAPKLAIANFEAMQEFWRYNAETVHLSGLENLWQIAFRGAGDAPYWSLFEDAPETDEERGAVASQMLRTQYNIIKDVTGEEYPYVRVTFYDEMSDLLAAGYLKPPTEKNMIWTFVAARRDHYPNTDLVNFDPAFGVALGYYMNFQFTSTGAHLAQAEGPWKMETNYRYVNAKAPLYFSVVNSGNQREFLFNLSANAAMMWDMESYNSDAFTHTFCEQYFGSEHAGEAAKLYRDFFYTYWQQKTPDFPGMERQYIFQDLRYARVFNQIIPNFKTYSDNPLREIGSERMQGRSFRIEGANQVDSLISGMVRTYPKFDAVASQARDLIERLEPQYRPFFRDNLLSQVAFMGALSRSMYHFMSAYKLQDDRTALLEHLNHSITSLEEARDHLYSNQHGRFTTWYEGDTRQGKFKIPAIIQSLKKLKDNIETVS